MSIYTKTGDKGSTSLFDSVRVKKYSLRVDTYGTFDECLAQISVAQKQLFTQELDEILNWIQEKLFLLNAEVATSANKEKLKEKSTLIQKKDTEQLESWIDAYLATLPEIHQFILPGSFLSSAQLHVARTICRRGERRLIELSEEADVRPELLQFVNRLSDCLYVLARVEDFNQQQDELIETILRRYQAKLFEGKETGDLEKLTLVFESCVRKAKELGIAVTIAVVDQSGNLVGSYRMKDSLLVSIDLSKKKAYTAVAMKSPTHALSTIVAPEGDLYQLETITDGKIVTFGGGLPIFDQQDRVIGGIGVSGGSVTEDQLIAQAGLDRMKEIDYARR
ncbi:ATP--cobalamin adenosyltransferase [Enterococcus florum]|uniref:Corrinoid adenosyltransferase n=1 Tax=Enterococcus florum TaxID=2480627 RepID=A0A4V0WPW1_9ENTE|nr:cob(I)yrinic acid a,c-diamide adenosyltransferase [Enterococcus florum]GCF95239.1 ATP--cobalamin adenosyltransferase [Enterococcus florum]